MKKIVKFIRSYSMSKGISALAMLALFIGVTSASAATFLSSYQPECPRELLK